MKTWKDKLLIFITIIPYIVSGGFIGAYLLPFIDQSLFKTIILYLLSVLLLCISLYLQLIIHEGGHLVFGLLTGYQFVSFRIGSIMLIRQNGQFHLKSFTLAGTAGQCLLSPPEPVDGKIPVVLYNLGGVIFNLFLSVLCLLLSFLIHSPLFHLFLILTVLMGLATILANGIPMKVNGVANDGYNALSIVKDPCSILAFYDQLKVNELQALGYRLKEMDTSLFELPPQADQHNVMVSTISVYKENQLMDQKQYDSALELIYQLLENETILELHQNLLNCDRMTIELIKNDSDTSILQNKKFKVFLRQMKNAPSVLRSQYAIELLKNNNEAKANSYLDAIKKLSKSYPYPQEIQSELEIIDDIHTAYIARVMH